ncbi:hypothetical protein Bca52824_056746 [Brassica carinata]|uniref:Argininosuccinate lyase n=1 Tax=Brassica carinata TaxID=52824 RepID=A0A8X7UFL1_BRACI|nr:hypothetical protein Bca52824_056746 [Brassica carinata]
MGALDLSLSQSLLFSPSRSYSPSSTHRSVSFLPPGSKPRCLPPLRSMSSHDDNDTASKETKLWGGRFEESVTEKVEKFTESISFDKVLYKQDIMGSKAHATMLAHQGLITDTDRDSILQGLDEIERKIERDEFEWRTDREDVHMNIEAALTDLIGEPAKKLHTARSRNDQVATDFRLWCRDAIDSVVGKIKNLQTALVQLALKNEALIVPGYTHLQRAQPVLLPHVLLTYVEQLERDAGRYIDCRERLNFCPLGACALAGTGLPIDRFMTATALGFTEPMRNSDSVSTGSSIMPQKKNPDPMELVRGKSARVIGDLVTVLTLCKGLPLAYNRDFQEDKEPMFDSTKTIMGMIDVSAEFAQNVTFNQERIKKSLPAGHLDATTLADYLVKKGMPFRSSHDVVGKLVGVCVSRGCELQNLSLEEMKKLSPVFEEDVFGFWESKFG